jgi:hypothetical protein
MMGNRCELLVRFENSKSRENVEEMVFCTVVIRQYSTEVTMTSDWVNGHIHFSHAMSVPSHGVMSSRNFVLRKRRFASVQHLFTLHFVVGRLYRVRVCSEGQSILGGRGHVKDMCGLNVRVLLSNEIRMIYTLTQVLRYLFDGLKCQQSDPRN